MTFFTEKSKYDTIGVTKSQRNRIVNLEGTLEEFFFFVVQKASNGRDMFRSYIKHCIELRRTQWQGYVS